ncbi:MAG TPA: glycoside hydrolase family 3 N-terminal domain-containing protein [Bryobacteraceae bacterium]|nr:glycoside hydrolase family 3 N-terminal domain-containing protein [Bryobacteraceae bacterium]
MKASATVRRWMRAMTPRDEVAQLIFVSFHGQSPNTRSAEYRRYARLVRELHIGGLILNNVSNGRTIQKAEPYKVAAFLNKMQRLAAVPLLVGGDFERGASMRLEGATVFPHAMAFGAAGDPALTRYEGEVTAREARAAGVQWILYPVADVNSNPENPIINIRSFGENPLDVAAHVKAFIEGAHSDPRNPVLVTAKHFPGHGDTSVDTHLNLASIAADRERLEKLELVPFKAAIAAGVDAIMTAHIAIPALAPADLPATLSPAILTGLLRNELGFKGLTVTDALDMGGIAQGFSSGEACVRALAAGADTLLMPADPDAAIRAVLAAEQSGRLSRQRIRESVARLLAAKERLGLERKRFVDVEALADTLDAPEANEKALEIAGRAVTLVRNQGSLVPLAAPDAACFVVMPEGRYSSEGQVFTQQVHKRLPQARLATLDPSMPAAEIDDALARLTDCRNYVVAAFASVTAARGSVGLAGDLPRAVGALIATGKPVVLIALGSPYLLRSFPDVAAYLATFSNVPPAETAAVQALWGEIAIRGRLPVSIPGIAQYGDGIPVPGVRVSGSAQ